MRIDSRLIIRLRLRCCLIDFLSGSQLQMLAGDSLASLINASHVNHRGLTAWARFEAPGSWPKTEPLMALDARDGDREPTGAAEPIASSGPRPRAGRVVDAEQLAQPPARDPRGAGLAEAQPTSGDRRAACDRRVQAHHADSDAPLTAQCPVPMPRVVNFSFWIRNRTVVASEPDIPCEGRGGYRGRIGPSGRVVTARTSCPLSESRKQLR